MKKKEEQNMSILYMIVIILTMSLLILFAGIGVTVFGAWALYETRCYGLFHGRSSHHHRSGTRS